MKGDTVKLLLKATSFAAAAHAQQRRKIGHEPYINHVVRVAEQAALAGLPDYAVAAALLHDVVEDTEVGLEEIRREFPPRVAEIVGLLTEWWGDHAEPKVQKAESARYFRAIAADPEALAVKLLDRADNLRDMIRTLSRARRWAESYLHRSEEEITPLLLACPQEYCRHAYLDAVRDLRAALARQEEWQEERVG